MVVLLRDITGVEVGQVDVGGTIRHLILVQGVPNGVTDSARTYAPFWELKRTRGDQSSIEPGSVADDFSQAVFTHRIGTDS